MLEEACTGVLHTYVPGTNRYHVVQVVPDARVMHPVLELERLVSNRLDQLHCLVNDEFPVQGGPATGVITLGVKCSAHVDRWIRLHGCGIQRDGT